MSGAVPSTRLSAVIACHGDAPAVPSMHARLSDVFRSLGVDYEIIFVNDGSPDNAREVLAELAARDPKVTVVTHTRAFGSQSAFTSGMRVATGDGVILLDGDLQDPPEIIPAMVEKWREGFEVVYGQRIKRDASRSMQVAYKLFYRMFRKLSYVPIPLDAGDFGLLDRRVVDTLNTLPERERFVRGLRAWVGFRQAGVPYVRPERPYGRSTNSLLKNLGWARRGIISMSYAPLNFIALLALFTMAASFLAMVVTAVLKLLYPEVAPRGITTVILVMLFIGAMQFLCLSIIGSYIAHIFEEVKGRPAYVVDEITNPPSRPAAAPGAPAMAPAAPAAEPAAPPEARPRTAAAATPERKRVLVTGAAGFIGANVVRRLVSDGHQVSALVSPASARWRLEGLEGSVVEGDICDAEAIRSIVGAVRPQWVFHLAAHGAYSWQLDADRIVATNLMGTIHLVEACKATGGCESFVHAGTSSEYGFLDRAASEDDPADPNSDYAVAKAAATSYCRSVARKDGFPAVTLRLYSVYGPYEEPGRLMPKLVSYGLRNELPPLTNPAAAHDFVSVDDTVEAFVRVATAGSLPAGAIYNVGTGVQTTLADVVAVARRTLGITAEPGWGTSQQAHRDTPCWVADISRIRRELGWEPALPFEVGFRRMADWVKATPAVWSTYGVGEQTAETILP